MKNHLSDIDTQEREKEAIFRLFSIFEIPYPLNELYEINSQFYIIGQNIPYNYILENTIMKGDIDICLINTKDYPQTGNNIVVPDFNKTIAFEIKTSTYTLNNELKSGKFNKQKKFREQANNLCKAGFNDVALIYLLTTEPEPNKYGNINDWIESLDNASIAAKHFIPKILTNKNDNFSTIGIFIGSLKHQIETYVSANTCHEFQLAGQNNYFDRKNEFRITFEKKIASLFPIDVPWSRFPIQIRACSNNKCRNLYTLFQGEKSNCPKCNNTPL